MTTCGGAALVGRLSTHLALLLPAPSRLLRLLWRFEMHWIRKRSLMFGARQTSVSLEDEFWDAFKLIAAENGVTTSVLAENVRAADTRGNLSSALRVFVLKHFQSKNRR